MKTSFAIHTYTGGDWFFADEAHVADHPNDLIERLREEPAIEGVLRIEHEGTEVELRDMLMTLVKGICFDAVAALCGDEQAYVYTYFTVSSVSVLAKSGDAIVLLSEDADDRPALRAKAADLLPALFRVGLRYVDLQRKFDAAGLAPPIPTQHLEHAANRARAALEQAGLPRSGPTE